MRGARFRPPALLVRLGGIVVVALLLLPSGAWALPGRTVPRAGQSGLGLTVTPTVGIAPLLVRFSVTTPNATTPNLGWTFGDGAYLNGSFQDVQAPAHAYERPGAYEAIVAAHYGGGDVAASAEIVVVASNLSASLTVSPPNGSAPLTVWLNGTPDGGSGTYVALNWDFGDGHSGSGLSVEYTYASPGTYVANFTVTDTLNETANASAPILVVGVGDPRNDSGAESRTSGKGSGFGVTLSPPVLTATAVTGAAVLVAIGAWVWSARRRTGTVGPALAATLSARSPPAPAAPKATSTTLETVVSQSPSAAAGPTPGSWYRTSAAPAGRVVPSFERPRSYNFVGTRQLSFRVLTLLLELSDARAAPNFSPTGTQAGLAERLGVGQSAVSKVLHQLVLGGVVEVTSAHVAGATRRVRVYRLTPKGDRLARALREGSSERAS